MARKKKKHQQDPSDDFPCSDVEPTPDSRKDTADCRHNRGSVNPRRLRQVFLRSPFRTDVCDECGDDGQDPKDVWFCLQCFHRGCGNEIPGQHALSHFETPRSDSHALALSSKTLEIWCFLCKCVVPATSQVDQIVRSLRKKLEANSKPSQEELQEGPCPNLPSSLEEPTAVCVEDVQAASENSRLKVVKGISNLGNTCYFNAVMQSLSHTPMLEELLAKRCAPKLRCVFEPAQVVSLTGSSPGPLDVELPSPGPLTSALLQFLREMREGCPRPRPLYTQVCRVAPQFQGHQQHDSHELLRHLLEGVRTEEVKRQMQGVLAAFGLSSKVSPGNVEPETKAKIQAYKEAVSRVPLDDLFGGLLLSTLICQLCGRVSQREETFQDLSLPIPDDKVGRPGRNCKAKSRQRRLEGGSTRNEGLSGGDPAEADEEDNAYPENLSESLSFLKLIEPAVQGPAEGSLEACLQGFVAPELLAGANGLHCDGCSTPRAPASLQLQVLRPPKMLTLQLKRFQQGSALRKVNRHVAFPQQLDLGPYCSSQAKGPTNYNLYGVVEHEGRMTSGHYTACVRGAGGWFHVSDRTVVPAVQRRVLSSQAYLLFYCRSDTECE